MFYLPPELQQYWTSRSGLTVYDGVLLYNDRTVIPPSARPRVLQVLHSAHQGVTGKTLWAEQSVFWPGMSEGIRNTRAACSTCHIIAPSQSHMPPVPPVIPAYLFNTSAATTPPFTVTTLGWWWTGSVDGLTYIRAGVGRPAWWT